MGHIVVTQRLNIPASRVWATIAELDTIADWNRSVAKAQLTGSGPGAKRRLEMYDGTELSEEITTYDEARRHLGFTVEGLPAPFASMNSLMTVKDIGEQQSELAFETEYALKGGIFGAAINLLVLRAILRKEHAKLLADIEHHIATGDQIGKDGERSARLARAS